MIAFLTANTLPRPKQLTFQSYWATSQTKDCEIVPSYDLLKPTKKSRKSHIVKNAAQRREFTIRIPVVCNSNFEAVVLAQYRLAGECGNGIKHGVSLAAFACRSCHDEIDSRTHILDNRTVSLYHADSVFRTQYILRKEGIIK